MTVPYRYFVVDAFASGPFTGNPAAVFPLELPAWPTDAWLQNVAMEMNLSETAFLLPSAEGYHLRWFTPAVEVDLCGHATLASAKVLADLGKLADGESVAFATRSGILRAERQGDGLRLDFPVKPQTPCEAPAGLLEALACEARSVGRNSMDFLVELSSASAVRGLRPDMKRLATVECRGVIVTAAGDEPGFDFVSRFFGPAVGIDEDPVTGSAHCCLADFWGKRLGKTVMVGYQASARGGVVRVEVRGDRVMLGGDAVVVARGEWLIA